jgi:hypothetical protein
MGILKGLDKGIERSMPLPGAAVAGGILIQLQE